MSILSIQSHVCYGHVGNSAAVFPLQRLGFEVWPVHSLQYSNHPGYGEWSGEVFAASKVAELLKSIEARGAFSDCKAVLSGYMGTAALGRTLLETVKAVRAANPEALFLCDPVMGDADAGLYVDPEIPEFLRREALHSADIITPNLFELGVLTGQTLEDSTAAIAAARQLLRTPHCRLKAVVITSVPVAAELSDGRDRIGILAVSKQDVVMAATPRLTFEPQVKGTGDLFAALYLANELRCQGDTARALKSATASLFAVISETHQRGAPELCLVAAQDKILTPDQALVDVFAFPD